MHYWDIRVSFSTAAKIIKLVITLPCPRSHPPPFWSCPSAGGTHAPGGPAVGALCPGPPLSTGQQPPPACHLGCIRLSLFITKKYMCSVLLLGCANSFCQASNRVWSSMILVRSCSGVEDLFSATLLFCSLTSSTWQKN